MLLPGERVDPFSGPVEVTVRAVIGDELRNPTVWCELAPCISRHGDPGALGEADIRSRALASGWRVDAFGRLVCLDCQGRDPRFRTTYPVVAWDRRAAVTRTALLAAAWAEEYSPVTALPDATDVIPALPAATQAPPPAATQTAPQAGASQAPPRAFAVALPPREGSSSNGLQAARAGRGRHRRNG